MITINAETIANMEAKGFNRWSKGNMDRMYINCQSYGCEFDYYNTGNIRFARFQGETISNAEGYRFKSTKVYVDLKTGELHIQTSTGYEDEIREAVEAILAECVPAEETTDDEPEANDEAEAIREAIITTIREQTESRIAQGNPSADFAARVRARAEGLVSKVRDASAEHLVANSGLIGADASMVLLAVNNW